MADSKRELLNDPQLANEVATKIKELLSRARSLQAVPEEFADHGTLSWQESDDHRNEIDELVARARVTLSHYGLKEQARQLERILDDRKADFFWQIQDTRHEGEYLVVTQIEQLLDDVMYAIQPRRNRPIGEGDPGGTVGVLARLCSRFHLVAGGFNPRYGGRQGIDIKDEYDVQDVMRGLLQLFFDDVRPEDYGSMVAGRRTRIDFVLPDEKIVVEAKMTRDTLTEKEVGDQLILDIARYSKHPDARSLVCFVYDPGRHIRNPRGLEKDLMVMSTEKLRVVVFIRPK